MPQASSILKDSEFGDIRIRRLKNARRLTFRFDGQHRLIATVPARTPLFVIRSTIETSRSSIRRLVRQQADEAIIYQDGMQIGKSHRLELKPASDFAHKLAADSLKVSYPSQLDPAETDVQKYIKPHLIKILRKQAKHYLPRRLSYLARLHGYQYTKNRLTHAQGRWGSASTTGTISLNIALMNLPFELIDYVLIHELCHTKEMNHSVRFWSLVEQADPEYKQHRKLLKNHHPAV